MRIGINLVPLIAARIGGAETYVRRLLEQLTLIEAKRHYFIFAASHAELQVNGAVAPQVGVSFVDTELPPSTRERTERWIARACGRFVGGPFLNDSWRRRMVTKHQLDAWFEPLTALTGEHPGCASVMTILDIQHEEFPAFFDGRELARRSRVYHPGCHAATRVIAISDFARRTLLDTYHLDPDKVVAIPLAAPSLFENGREVGRATVIAGLRKRYVFYPANTYPHKNHVRLIEAFRRLRSNAEFQDLQLVLCGGVQWNEDEVLKAAGELLGTGDILRLGHVPTNLLPGLYRHAEFMAFPSLYEGFGIPLLEAMHAGCPVLTTRCGSIPEVAGEAALYVDGQNVDSLNDGMQQLLRDGALRDALRRRGFERARQFSYERCARETLRVIEEAVREFGPRRRSTEPTCIGKHNLAYDRSFIAFHCHRAKEIVLELSPLERVAPCRLSIRANDREYRLQVGATEAESIRMQAPVDRTGLNRLDFRIRRDRSRLSWRRWLAWPVCRITKLIAVRDDGTEFPVIGPSL